MELRFGTSKRVRLDAATAARVHWCDVPRGQPIADVAAAVDEALAAPLDYPPLVQAATPGDKVALALDRGVPGACAIVARTISALVSAGVRPADITLLQTEAGAAIADRDPLELVVPEIRQSIASHVHDPAHREALGYLGASAAAKPIYINRWLHDADLVIAIGCLRLAGTPDYHGVHTTIFPAFSDRESQARFRSVKPGKRDAIRLDRQAAEATWLLGLQFTIQVVPGENDAVLHVLAGGLDAVAAAGERLSQQAWSCAVPSRAALTVATIDGDASQQTWENVGRALASTARAVDDEGAILLLTDLSDAPGAAVQQLAGSEDLDRAIHAIEQEALPDGRAALELARALQRGKVYLVSGLDEDTVESLGLLPVEAGDVARLVARYESCCILPGAQYAQAHAAGDTSLAGGRG